MIHFKQNEEYIVHTVCGKLLHEVKFIHKCNLFKEMNDINIFNISGLAVYPKLENDSEFH